MPCGGIIIDKCTYVTILQIISRNLKAVGQKQDELAVEVKTYREANRFTPVRFRGL